MGFIVIFESVFISTFTKKGLVESITVLTNPLPVKTKLVSLVIIFLS